VIRNDGSFPGMARGKRVRVKLFGGTDSAATSPEGWPADTQDWTIHPQGHPLRKFDIEFFEVLT
jgi:hypothetical protein